MGKKIMNKNIVVVGGGSAGWLTALMAKKTYPKANVTLIESKEIGILGAGESTVPPLLKFFKHLEVPFADLVKYCDATVKNGIKFTNWNDRNDFYYHGFAPIEPALGMTSVPFDLLYTSPRLVSGFALNSGLREVEFSEKLSEEGKVPFIFKSKGNQRPIDDYENIGTFAFHVNATKLAGRLKDVGTERGVNLIDGIIKEVSLDDNQYIKGLVLDSGQTIPCDFVFDCSGFHRLIIGKTLKSKWKSYKDFLPSDAAIPFFIEMTDDIPAYTECIAMKYGWMWKIPLQTRFGCGYVYDSSLISEEEAAKEIEEFLGYEPNYPRKDKGGFSFNAGSYEETWINNCLAVGLAGNFIEPLEATSLWTTSQSLIDFFSIPNWISNNKQAVRDEFNRYTLYFNGKIVEFLYLHYMTNRTDTEFWKRFTYEGAPDELKVKLDLWKERLPNRNDFDIMWSSGSWTTVASGQGVVDPSLANMYLDYSEDYKKAIDTYDHFISYRDYRVSQCVKHRDFLEYLK
jgi:tryptophan halogenase